MIGQDTSRTLRKIGGRLARLGGVSAEYDWQAWFRSAVRRKSVDAVLRGHPLAARLDKDFNVGAYLELNQDISDAVASPGEAAFHYLEFGLAEGRIAKPQVWSPAFVRRHHAIAIPETATASEANARLRREGVGPADALLHEPHLWQVLGVCGPIFASIFEHEYYAVAAAAAGLPLPATDRLSAIRHFCATGLSAGVPPHPDHRFDAEFYRDAMALVEFDTPPEDDSAAALRRHWARIGVRAGLHANPQAWVLMKTGMRLPDTVLHQIDAFRAASKDLDIDASLAATLSHLEATPMPGLAQIDRGAEGVVDFLVEFGRYKRRSNEPGTAEMLLMLALEQQPDHARGNIDIADLIYSQNRISTEIQFRRAAPPDFDIGANQITLAERLFADNRPREALLVCERLPDTVASDVTLRRRRRDLGRTIFDALWNDQPRQIERLGVAPLQSLMTQALDLYTTPFTPPRRSRPIRRIAVLANDDLYQCKLYRADQKLDQLRAAGYEAELFAQSRDLALLHAQLDRFDAVIFMRLPAFPKVIDLIADAAQLGLATFYECDDLIFDPAVFPPPLATYSGNITAPEHDAIACGVPLFRYAMGLCDYGIASTPTIRDAMAKVVRSGQVFVHRNALGAAHMRVLDRVTRPDPADPADRANGKLVLYYGSGTKAHKAEFHDILEPALAQVLKARRGKVEVRIIGEFADFKHLDANDPDVRLIPPIWDFEAFCAEVAQGDINLSILAPGVLTDAKSEIKWMEAAMFAIPSVVTPTATHRDVIEDAVTGFLRDDRAGFVDAITRLVDDPGLRARVGEAAKAKVLRDYSLQALGANFDAIFEAVRPADAAARKARILIVNVFYPPQDIGGATRVVQDNVTDLIARYGDRFEIDVVCTLEGGEIPYEVKTYARDGARIWTVTARSGIKTMDISDPGMADVFDRLLGRIAPDLVHFHCVQRLTASIVDATRKRDIPYAITLHDGWWMSPNQFVADPSGVLERYDFRPAHAAQLPERGRIARRCLDDAAALLAVSEAFAEEHRACGLDTVETVENGVSTLPDLIRTPAPEGRVRIGHIGGASRHKGFALLRAAIEQRRYANLDLVILDHALPLGQTRHEVWNGTPVTFLPRLPLHRVGEIYGQIDVLAAPSTWPESYGLVTREALALGLWVIASDRGAIGQDVIEGETGHIVPVHDHTGLAACLAHIDAAPERYRAPPAQRPTLRRASDQVDETVAIYDRILRPRGSEQKI